MNKKIALSGISILTALTLVGAGAFAFFSDTETSTGNILAAGALDLKIDNTCYYNGNACIEGFFQNTEEPCSCTWKAKDLEEGDLFWDLRDLKPGDWEEDTISLEVDNDSWVCADVTLTSDDNNSQTEPEEEDGDVTPGPIGEGELADEVNFIWWADDGDNVLEDNETPLPSGPMGVLNVGQTATVALADSNQGIWGPGPLPGGETKYIGKAWCFGDLTLTPVASGSGNPTVDPGFDCDGTLLNNITQTDSFTSDISFRAVQARNNDQFQCTPPVVTPTESPTPTHTPTPTPGPG